MAKLIRKNKIPYAGKVYDLSVENSHTYNIEKISVHNSAAGGLINFLLGITQVDPIKHDLLWERFLGRHRCINPTSKVITKDGVKFIDDVTTDDEVLTSKKTFNKVLDKTNVTHDIVLEIEVDDQIIKCSPNHKWIVERAGIEMEIMACNLLPGDNIITLDA